MASVAASVVSPSERAGVTPRLPLRRAVVAGLVVSLARPASWVVALVGFLAGGGALVLAWPIVVLPTPSGLQNLLGAPVSTLAFGDPSPGLVQVIVASVLGTAVLLVAGLLIGAWSEGRSIALALEGAAEEGFRIRAPDAAAAPGPWAVAVVRALALVPPLLVGVLGWPALYNAAYQELVLPEDLVTPLPIRVIARVPLVLVSLAGAWLLADAAAAVGVRRLVFERRSVAAAWALGWTDLVRRPHRILAVALLGDAVLVLACGPALVAAALAWVRVREALELAGGSPVAVAVVALWVGIWLGAVVLAGVGAAVRSALFTLEGARRS